ncbi:MAG: hypothetical protein ACXWIA_11400 [Candidatus Aminicenantales bacterium]
MGSLFGVVGHSHLGTKRGGLAAGNGASFVRYVHNIENAHFRRLRSELDLAARRAIAAR